MLGILHERSTQEANQDPFSSKNIGPGTTPASRRANSRNKLSASALTNFFEARREAVDQAEVDRLQESFNLDSQTRATLEKYFTSPSAGKVTIVGEEKEEIISVSVHFIILLVRS
jgi:hypothetical protein